MKKSFFSLALLHSLQLISSTVPVLERGPDRASSEAVDTVESSDVLSELGNLEETLEWASLCASDRAEVMASLGVLIAKGELLKGNFNEKAKGVILRLVARRALREARQHVHEGSAISVANSMHGNARALLNKNGINKYIVDEYTGKNLSNKVKKAAHENEHSRDRHCSYWC